MTFESIRTERLILRAPEMSDAEVAQVTGRTTDRSAVAQTGSADGQGWNLTVVDGAEPDRIVGDLHVGIQRGGRSAEIGYTFHPDYSGRGYAAEAATALVRHLFDEVGVRRIEGSLHADNPSSARVLEACGMTFEGLSRQSFWVGDDCSDNAHYAMTRADWEAWCRRPRHRPSRVELVPITADNQVAVSRLTTHKSQERFVSPVTRSFADALFPPVENGAPLVPWYRAIEADGDIVGFLMAAEVTDTNPNPYLWRFLIDRMHQRRGVGSAALDLYEDRCRAKGASAIEVTWIEGPGSPAPLYRARGYEPTGRIIDGETHAVKRLASGAATGSPSWVSPPEMSDEAMIEATGRSHDQWADIIEAYTGGVDSHDHPTVARHLQTEYELSAWWAQSVTVGYERIRGLRLPHQRSDGTFAVSRSTTVVGDGLQLRRRLLDDGLRAELFPGFETTLRSRPDSKAVRIGLGPPGAVVRISIDQRTDRFKVTVQHEKLPSYGVVDDWKSFWGRWLESLESLS